MITAPVPHHKSAAYNAAILHVLNTPEDATNTLNLAGEGLSLWHELAASAEGEMRPGGAFEHFRDWAGTLPGQTLRLAGLLHLFKTPGQSTIDTVTVQAAIELAALCADHANAVFALMGAAPEVECARKILAWVAQGSITPGEGQALSALAANHAKAIEVQELEARIKTLEEKQNDKKY